MSIQCEYDVIAAPNFTGEISREVKLEAKLKLADNYRPINQIKGGYFQISPLKYAVEQDVLMISGTVFPRLLYVTEAEAKNPKINNEDVSESEKSNDDYLSPLEYGYTWNGIQGVYFEEKIEISGLNPSMYVEVERKPLNAQFEREGFNEVSFRGVLELSIHTALSQNVTFIRELQSLEKINAQKETVLVGEMFGRKQASISLQPSLILPNLKPGINRILDYQVNPAELSIQSLEDRTYLKGFVEVTLVYVGTDDEGRPTEIFVNEWNREFGNAVPFELAIDLPHFEREICLPKVSIGNVQMEINSDRGIRCQLELMGEVKVMRIMSKEIVTEVTASPGEVIDFEKSLLNIEEYLGDICGDVEMEMEAILPQGLPDIERILSYQIRLGKFSVEAGEEKLVIDGDLDVWVEYMADGVHSQRLSSASWEAASANSLPVAGVLEFSGLSAGAILISQLSLGRVKLEVASERRLRLSGKINANVIAKVPRALMAVQNCAIVNPVDPSSRPSMLFYVVQPEDTLWKIARFYQTTVDSLMKANQITSSCRIDAGQKLIIPKKVG